MVKDLKTKWTNGRLKKIQRNFWMVMVKNNKEFLIRSMDRKSQYLTRETVQEKIKNAVPREIWEGIPSISNSNESNIYICYFKNESAIE